MEAKFTPGPWKVIPESVAQHVEVFEVAEVSHFRVIPDRLDTWATQGDAFSDARLIAAAPELLEALISIAEDSSDEGARECAMEAIAKATGETP